MTSISNEIIEPEQQEQQEQQEQPEQQEQQEQQEQKKLYNGEPYKIVHISFDVHKTYKEYVQISGIYKLHKLIDQALREWMIARQNDNLYKEIRKHTDNVLASLSQLSTITSMLNKFDDK